MVRVFSSFQTGRCTEESTSTTKNMGTVSSYGRTGRAMMETGTKASNMVSDTTLTPKKGSERRVSGSMGSV